MLKNFLQTSYLKKYYPNIDSNLWKNTSDFSMQIDLGFTKFEQDLLSRGIDTRKIMLPYVLTSSIAVSSSLTTEWFEISSDYKRLYVKSENSAATDNVFLLQGSHDKTTIKDVTTLTVNGNGNENVEITELYKYYRATVTGTALNATVEMYETIYDRALTNAAFIFIYRDFMKEPEDIWDIRRKFAEQDYSDSLNSLKVIYDADDNQDPSNDSKISTLDITLVR
ncbi:MAG: hypothetical protein WC306_03410 [Candidatus Paceibacterota bacterium]|jgi:hypothetical protein